MALKENETLIKSGNSVYHYWRELWLNRELFWIFAKRDVMVRYKQTVLGVAWSVIRPLLTTLVMVFAFGKIAKLEDSSSIPYMLIVLPGVMIWLFFSQSLQQISFSIVGNANLIAKVYFPRLLIPFSSLLVSLIDALIAFALFVIFCFWYGFLPNWQIVFAPVFLILAYFGAFGAGLIAGILNVKFRDIGQIIPFAIQFGYFVSPVAYTSDRIKDQWWYFIYNLNPVAGAIDGLRWSMLGTTFSFNWESFIPLILFDIITVVIAIRLFRKAENSFVDYL